MRRKNERSTEERDRRSSKKKMDAVLRSPKGQDLELQKALAEMALNLEIMSGKVNAKWLS